MQRKLKSFPDRVAVSVTSGRLVRVTVKTVGKNEESRRPQSNENSKSFRMTLSFGSGATGQEPDDDRAQDGSESEKKAEITELFELSGLHTPYSQLVFP